MITTMYYYNYYKPYMFKGKKNEAVKPLRDSNAPADKTASQSLGDAPSTKRLLLNKTLNKDVVNYAHNVSRNLTSLKDTSKYIGYDIDEFYSKSERYGYEQTKSNLKEDVVSFVDTFNSAYSFYSSQGHSQSLVDFSIGIDNTVTSNAETLGSLGISIDENNQLQFDSDTFDQLDRASLSQNMTSSKGVFKDIYNRSSSALSVPLAEHMNFKSLNYYYNYKFGGVVADTFKVIESGMIIDEVV